MGQVWMHRFVFAQWFIFLIDFKGLFHYVAHLVGPPSSLSPWFIILHLWSTFGPSRDPPFLMLCNMFLHLLWRMRYFMFYMNKVTFFHHLFFGLCINESTLWFWWMTFKHWLSLSSLSPLEQIWFHKQLCLMGLLLQLQLSLKKPFIVINTQ